MWGTHGATMVMKETDISTDSQGNEERKNDLLGHTTQRSSTDGKNQNETQKSVTDTGKVTT